MSTDSPVSLGGSRSGVVICDDARGPGERAAEQHHSQQPPHGPMALQGALGDSHSAASSAAPSTRQAPCCCLLSNNQQSSAGNGPNRTAPPATAPMERPRAAPESSRGQEGVCTKPACLLLAALTKVGYSPSVAPERCKHTHCGPEAHGNGGSCSQGSTVGGNAPPAEWGQE